MTSSVVMQEGAVAQPHHRGSSEFQMRQTMITNCFTNCFILLLVRVEDLKSSKEQTQIN